MRSGGRVDSVYGKPRVRVRVCTYTGGRGYGGERVEERKNEEWGEEYCCYVYQCDIRTHTHT